MNDFPLAFAFMIRASACGGGEFGMISCEEDGINGVGMSIPGIVGGGWRMV